MAYQGQEMEEIYDDVADLNEQSYAKDNSAGYLPSERHHQSSNRGDETAGDLLQLPQNRREEGEKQGKTRNIPIAVLMFHFVLLLGAIAGIVLGIFEGK